MNQIVRMVCAVFHLLSEDFSWEITFQAPPRYGFNSVNVSEEEELKVAVEENIMVALEIMEFNNMPMSYLCCAILSTKW